MRTVLFFWFDTEDYITPQSDVALGRLVDLFDRHGLKATFKLVGEKMRGLQRRGHWDILRKLQAHDIGYHTDWHSRPPSISEYELPLGWEDGTGEFMRREQAGLDVLTRAFGRMPACYGQPGGAWAPQVYPALRQWGIPTYLDAGPWVNLHNRPHRYGDILNILDIDGLAHIGIGGGAANVQRQKAWLAQTAARMRHTGGEISLYAHECEFVTSAFWDGVNFARGQDTPPERWRPAPLLDPAESETRFAAMDEFLTFVQSLPNVEVVGAAQLPALYPDQARGRDFTTSEIAGLAASMAEEIAHQQVERAWLSPGEVFGLVVGLLAARIRQGIWPQTVSYRYADGPPAPPHVEAVSSRLSLDDAFGTCLFEDAALVERGHLPAEVQVGRNWLSPADFLATVGTALPRWVNGSEKDVPILKGHFVQARHVPDHVEWGWTIFPPGFDGDPLLGLGQLQAWTLKPAPLAK